MAGAAICLAAPAWCAGVAADAVELGGFDVVIMGEIHDNPEHHVNQAAWLTQMSPVAVVFEMLTPTQAGIAQDVQADGPAAIARATGWAESGWPDFTLYAPVFRALGAASIFGADVARGDLRAAMADGAASVLGDDAAAFGLTAPLDVDEQARREKLQADAHCGALPAAMLPTMIEAQRLRDGMLARAVIQALDTVGGPVAVITGNGHARTDWGVPALLKTARPELRVLSIGQIEDGPPGTDTSFDVPIATSAAVRDDPCAVFR